MTLLQQFDLLRDNDPQKRLTAALNIFSELDISSKPVVQIDDANDLLQHYGKDTQYTFSRLIKGLASNRESARLGFSAALSEMLRALPKISMSLVLDTIEKATTPVGKVKGQETRDLQFGRILGIQAMCTSGLLIRQEVSLDELNSVFGQTFELAMSKGWLRESCASVIVQILDSLDQAGSQMLFQAAEAVHRMLYDAQLSNTMEGIAISLKCTAYGSQRELQDWKHANILHADNLQSISKIMKGTTPEETTEGSDKQIGLWKPKLHFAWMLLIRAILLSNTPQTIKLSDFWQTLVDHGLFAAGASHERKFWGFQLFSRLISELDVESISILFTSNFLRTLSNQIAKKDNYLYKAAKAATAAMVSAAQNNQSKSLVILSGIWEHVLFFDRLSKDKTCESLMLLTPAGSRTALVKSLIGTINVESASETDHKKAREKRAQFVADCLLLLLRNGKISNEGSWVFDVLRFLSLNGFFEISKLKYAEEGFVPDVTEAVRAMFRARLQSALGYLMPREYEQGVTEIYASHVVRIINEYKSKRHYNLILKPDEEVTSQIELAEKELKKLEKRLQKPKYQDEALAFILLYTLSLLQVYSGDAEAAQILADLNGCHARIFSKTSEKPNDAEDEDLDVMFVLTDLLISFLSRESALFRKLVESVFAVFTSKVNKESMTLLLKVLSASKDGEGLLDKDDDEASNEEDEDMIDEDEADHVSDTSSSESDPEIATEGDAHEDKEFDNALATVLSGSKRKAAAISNGHGKSSKTDFDASDDDDEELMDDDQMFQIDSLITDMFKKQKLNSGKSAKKDREAVTASTNQLKSKVLGLLDQFASLEPSSGLILEILLPVLQAARISSDSQFQEKAQTMIRQRITKSKVLPSLAREDVPGRILELIKSVHIEAERSTTPPQLAACSQTSLFLTKILLTQSMEYLGPILEIYSGTQLTWVTKKHTRLTTMFFVDLANWLTQWRANLHKTKAK